MEGLISFLITIAFYTFLFRAIKKIAGKGRKAAKKKTVSVDFSGKTASTGLAGFLKKQSGLSQLMESIKEAQRIQQEKLETSGTRQAQEDDYDEYIDEDEEVPAINEIFKRQTAPVRPAAPEPIESVPATGRVIEGKDLKKALIYSEIIAPPLALR